MPLTSAGFTGALIPNLASASMLGTGVPMFCQGVGSGLSRWLPLVKIATTDVGTVGVGRNVPQPLTVVPTLLLANLLASTSSQGFTGVQRPLFLTGLSNGLSTALAQTIINTTHPSVGTGTGRAQFVAPPAFPFMISGFLSAGMKGEVSSRMAVAIASALNLTLATLVIPIVIVGPTYTSGSTGVGFGSLL